MPRMHYGHIADYITIGANGKPILVGVFDRVMAPPDVRPIQLPLSYLFVALQCSIGEGVTHNVAVQLRDGNSDPIGEPQVFEGMAFTPTGPGYPLHANILLFLIGANVPDVGDYHFEVVANGSPIGEVAFVVVSVPPNDTPAA